MRAKETQSKLGNRRALSLGAESREMLGAIFKRWYPDMDLEVEEISVAA